jgi:peptide/nickel transport system substrate-binding protein
VIGYSLDSRIVRLTSESRGKEDAVNRRLTERSLLVTRRRFLGATAGLAGLSLLAACGGTAATPTLAAKVSAGTSSLGATSSTSGPTTVTRATTTAGGAGTPSAQRGGELVIANVGADPDMLDPQITAWNATSSLGINLFDPLVWADARDNSYKPGLAESWEATPDATVYTFKLRKDVKFHDGTPFNADAVKFNFDRIADPKTASKLAVTLLGPYDSTEVVDDYTVKIHFKSPYGAFLDGASRANLGMASPTAVQKYGPDFGRNPVGSGAFKFKEWVANQDIALVRNPDYNWASPLFTHQGPPHLDALTYRSVPEQATADAAFEKGELQVNGIPYNEVARYEQAGKYTVIKFTYRGFPSSYLINTEKEPTNDLQVRKALLYAISPELVVKVSFANVPKPAHAPLNSSSLGYDPEIAKLYPLDPERAKKTLDDAGWKLGGDGIRAKNGTPLKLTFIAGTGWEPYAVPVQAQLRQVGIDMEIRILAPAARTEADIKGEHHLAGLGFSNSDPSVLTNIFHSKNIANGFAWSRFRSQELDDLLDKAQGVPDLNQRKQLYSQIQHIIMDNALCVPLVEGASILAYPQTVHDITFDTRGFPYYFDSWMQK